MPWDVEPKEVVAPNDDTITMGEDLSLAACCFVTCTPYIGTP
jgi:hypothetical protein